MIFFNVVPPSITGYYWSRSKECHMSEEITTQTIPLFIRILDLGYIYFSARFTEACSSVPHGSTLMAGFVSAMRCKINFLLVMKIVVVQWILTEVDRLVIHDWFGDIFNPSYIFNGDGMMYAILPYSNNLTLGESGSLQHLGYNEMQNVIYFNNSHPVDRNGELLYALGFVACHQDGYSTSFFGGDGSEGLLNRISNGTIGCHELAVGDVDDFYSFSFVKSNRLDVQRFTMESNSFMDRIEVLRMQNALDADYCVRFLVQDQVYMGQMYLNGIGGVSRTCL